MSRLGFINIFANEIEALSNFYIRVFNFTEIETLRSPIHIALETGGTPIGFNALDAYALLELSGYQSVAGVKFMLTIDVEKQEDVERLTELSVENGAKLIKEPYKTYYGWYQSVLLDPEGNVFRINFVLS